MQSENFAAIKKNQPKTSARKMKLIAVFNDGTFSFMLHHTLTLC